MLTLEHLASPNLTSFTDQPLFGIALTVGIFLLATQMQQLLGNYAILNPTLVTINYVAFVLMICDVPYTSYMKGAVFIQLLLAVAVVLLAVPLYRQAAAIKASRSIIGVSLLVGLPVGVLSGVGIAWFLGADATLLASIAPRTITAGVASTTAGHIGGIPALTGILAVMTGVTGAIIGPAILKALRIERPEAVGLALGISSHGIGTAEAAKVSERAGAFSSLSMILAAIAGAVLLPLIVRFL